MTAKRLRAPSSSDEVLRRELAYLYSRRSAVEALIRSLERYEKSRVRSTGKRDAA